MPTPQVVAVTGGTGLVGRALLRALVEEGIRPVALVRSPPRRSIDPSIEQRAWDATSRVAPLAGVDAVVHLAGAPVAAGRWTAARKRELELSRILGTRSIVAGIREHGPVATLVSASGIDFHGDTGDAPVDESSPPGRGFLPELAVRWEQEAEKAEELGTRVVTLRTGMVLAREGGALAQMLPIFRAGLGATLGKGSQKVAWIHLADEVGLILHALRDEAVRGPLLAVSPEPVTNRAFTQALAASLGRPAFLWAPSWALRALLGELAGVVLASHDARPAKALATGYRFRFPTLDEAFSDLFGAPASSRRGR